MNDKLKIYHLCNHSAKVIFRDCEDYLSVINRMAVCAFETGTEIWAYAVMSTHFHLIARSLDIGRFIKLFKFNISTWRKRKYLDVIKLSVTKRELKDKGEIKTAVNYVLKNPVHHQLVSVAMNYPFSSAHLYFADQIARKEYYSGEFVSRPSQKPSELSSRARKKMFGSHIPPDNFEVLDGKLLLPRSFVQIGIIERLYQTPRNFLYNATKPLAEELQMFGEIPDATNYRETQSQLFNKLTDMDVCELIDSFSSPRPFTQLLEGERAKIANILVRKGADRFQIERCL